MSESLHLPEQQCTILSEETMDMGMRDIIGMDSFMIGDVSYTDADLESLPLDRLEDLKIKVSSDIIAISTQIKTIQIKADAGLPIDETVAGIPEKSADWLIKANHALSKNQRFLPYLSSIIKKRRQSGRSVASYFMDVAREELDAQDFQSLLEESKARHRAENP